MLCLPHACVMEELAKYIVLICYNLKSLEIHAANAFTEYINRETGNLRSTLQGSESSLTHC